MTRSKVLLFVVTAILVLSAGIYHRYVTHRFEGYEEQIESIQTLYEEKEQALKEQIERSETYYNRIVAMQTEINELKAEILVLDEALCELEEVLQWERRIVEMTAYAPLDPDAVPGFDYSGNPAVTASGEPSTPYVSVAMGGSIPFGTEVFIEGYGFRTVHDRGGSISDRHLDMMVTRKADALSIGRRKVTVYIKK